MRFLAIKANDAAGVSRDDDSGPEEPEERGGDSQATMHLSLISYGACREHCKLPVEPDDLREHGDQRYCDAHDTNENGNNRREAAFDFRRGGAEESEEAEGNGEDSQN